MVFSVTQSPFILKGTLKSDFENSRHEFEKTVSRIKKDTYVDDLVTRGNTLDEVSNVKKKSAELFQKRVFITYKCNSNMSGRESHNVDVESELTFAKQIFNHDESEFKILVLGWNKSSGKINVVTAFMKHIKRNILSELTSVYDPIYLISWAHLLGKLLYCMICEICNLCLLVNKDCPNLE